MKLKHVSTVLAAALMTVGASQVQAKELRMATAAPEKTPWGAWFNGVVDQVYRQRVLSAAGGDHKCSVGNAVVAVEFCRAGRHQITEPQVLRKCGAETYRHAGVAVIFLNRGVLNADGDRSVGRRTIGCGIFGLRSGR